MQGEPGRALSVARSLPCWALSAAAGAVADRFGVPLAWVLAPLIVTAAFSIAGHPPVTRVEARRLGQVIVGSAIGLNMTGEAALKLIGWLPVMILTALVSLLLAAAFSRFVARLGRVDTRTAYFALLPGGLSEMANVGSRLGARSEAISLSHALRVALAVLIIPPVVLLIDTQIDLSATSQRPVLGWAAILMLGAAALAGAMLLRAVRLANPWMLGALAAAGLLAGSGLVEGRVPNALLWAGQFLIGIAIGVRFKRDILRRLPRFAAVSSLATVCLGLLMAGYAGIIRSLGPSDYESLLLAVSPGGFAEMTLTAKSLGLDVALVTGFHFVRAFAVNGLALPIWLRLEKLTFFAPNGGKD